MRKLPIILILLLTILWAYTSWYWYTCNIKWFCSVEKLDVRIPEEKIISTVKETTWPSGSIIDIKTEPSLEELPEIHVEEKEKEIIIEICDDIISQAISLWWEKNNIEEVKNVEGFLNTKEGETLDIDGRYSQDDFDAIKRFQLKYREDILDPWGISTPTGYIYTTTIKKINELHCK